MKKIVIILSFFLLMMGCDHKDDKNTKLHNENTNISVTEDEYKDLTKEIGEEILNGNPEVIKGKLSSNVLNQVGEDELIQSIKSILGSESLLEMENISVEEKDGLVATVFQGKMTTTTGYLTITYNTNKEIEGIFYNAKPRTQPSSKEDEKNIKIGDKEPLDGILKIGNQGESSPLVLLIPGSGPQDMDETIFDNKPLKDIADGLAENGISSIRYHKRTYVYPEKFMNEGTIEDEYLKDMEWILEHRKDFTKGEDIYLLGHSQGGMIIPAMAERHPDIKGLIIMAGSPRKFIDIMYDQLMESTPKNDQEKVEALYKSLKNQEDNPMVPVSYLKSLDQVEGEQFLKKLDLPILILQGEEDFQVKADKDFKLYKDILKEKENVTFILYPKLNHLFMESNGKKSMDEYKEKGKVSQEVIDDIVSFIQK
ncbi:MAG: alpha/beta fold hydrolase [Tissierellia bacterium]|nr:alpha/beta fold hydrolase [Tissierellia bacterium]